jgi:hypothetical protein
MSATAEAGRFSRAHLLSPLEGVPDRAWEAYVRACSVAGVRERTSHGLFGSFAMRARRLGEIGVLECVRRDDRGVWVGDFVPPDTEEGFLASPARQIEVFSDSTRRYDVELSAGVASGAIARPAGASRSGCLAILHCGGIGAIQRFPGGAFASTTRLFQATNNLF